MSENFVGPKAKIAQNKKQREGGRNSKNHQKIESPIEAIGSLRKNSLIWFEPIFLVMAGHLYSHCLVCKVRSI